MIKLFYAEHTDMQQRRELAHRHYILDKSRRLASRPPVTHSWVSRGQSCNIPCDHMCPIPSAVVTRDNAPAQTLELDTKLRKNFTIMEKAPTRAFC